MLPSFSERKKKIIALICEIPAGQVASYGQVAELAGRGWIICCLGDARLIANVGVKIGAPA